MKDIVTWFRAIFLGYNYWRVTYTTGERTRLLGYSEAKNLKEIFKGKLWIDYTRGIKSKTVEDFSDAADLDNKMYDMVHNKKS